MNRFRRVLPPRGLPSILAALALQGCFTSPTQVMEAYQAGQGTSVTYAIKPDQAYDLTKVVFRWNGSELIEEHREQNYVLTNIDQAGGNGAICGAWVERVSDETTKVTVVTKRRNPTSITTPLTETTFQEDFRRGVEILHAGKSLPLARPQ